MDRNRQTSHNVKSNFRKQFCRTVFYDSVKGLSYSILIQVFSCYAVSKEPFKSLSLETFLKKSENRYIRCYETKTIDYHGKDAD